MTTPNFSTPHSPTLYQNPACTPLRSKAYHWAEKRQEVRNPRAINCQGSEGRLYAPDNYPEQRKRLL